MIFGRAQVGEEGGHAAGRKLLENLYREHIGKLLPEIAVTERGKPYFKDTSWHFSISHTPKHVFCALSQKEIGLDAEELDRQIKLGLAEKILSPSEKLEYEKAEDQRLALLTFWVLKEAQAKLTGEGLRGYPSKTTAFSLADPRIRIVDGCLVAIIEDKENKNVI